MEASGKHKQRGVGEERPQPHQAAPRPCPWLPIAIKGDWGKLLEQVNALALWTSQREQEVLSMERPVEWWEETVEGREGALEEEVGGAILEMK